MKFTIVTQWVKLPPVQSLANWTVVTPAGKPGNWSPKPGGARVQAAGLSPEMSIVVDRKDNLAAVGKGTPTPSVERKAAVRGAQRRAPRTPPGSESGAGTHRGNLGTWESPLSPCHRRRQSRGTG